MAPFEFSVFWSAMSSKGRPSMMAKTACPAFMNGGAPQSAAHRNHSRGFCNCQAHDKCTHGSRHALCRKSLHLKRFLRQAEAPFAAGAFDDDADATSLVLIMLS